MELNLEIDRSINALEERQLTRDTRPAAVQRLLVFQQKGSAEKKIKGIRDHGDGRFEIEVVSLDLMLPVVIDEAEEYLDLAPLEADLVLDFLKHPDLSQEVALHFSRKGIPVVASGKKWRMEHVFSPPT
jgi:thymidylate synthase